MASTAAREVGRYHVALGVLFAATGAAALIAEQVFERLLSTLVGTSSPAAAITLSVYFAGLTLGGLAYVRLLAGRCDPLMTYARAELAVGVVAISLAAGFERLIVAFVPLLRLGADSPPLLLLLRLVVAACWILPPTIAMGLSFPAIVDTLALMAHGSSRSRRISWFYALNLLGAIGGAAGGVFLFSAIGLDGALLLIAAVEFTVYLVASRVSRRIRGEAVAPATAEPAAAAPAASARVLVMIAFASGFLFFALEIVWTHLITVVCGNSVYAFATMLTSVLAGLFAGGVLSSRIFSAQDRLGAGTLIGVLLGGAAVLLIGQQLWPAVPHLFTILGANIHSFWWAELLRGAVAFALLFPAATVLGTVFPLLFRLRDFPDAGQGAMAGRMTAANALGSIAGALVTGFVLIPAIGSEATLRILVASYAAAGAAAAFLPATVRVRRAGVIVALTTCAAVAILPRWDRLALTSGEHVYFRRTFVEPDSRLMFFEEDFAGGITTVVGTPGRGRVLLTNGKFQGNDSGERLAQLGFALAPALHLTRLDDVLVIGLGTGQTARSVRQLGFSNIHVAEISPAMVDAARQFGHINGGIVDDPHVRIHVEDGRNLLLLDRAHYDLITMEVSSIWFAGATSLYSREFYALARQRLKPGGVFQQWVQLHHINTLDLLAAILTVREVFPNVSFWVIGKQGVVVATDAPQILRATGLRAAQRALASSDFASQVDLRGLLTSRVLSPRAVDVLRSKFETLPLNTDRNRRMEYRTPRQNLSRIDWYDLNYRYLVAAGRVEGSSFLAEISLRNFLQNPPAK